METTFITIHDLSRDARILYSSDSIVDILGHTPDEVVNRSAWEFFHRDEIPFAQEFHERGVQLDKAAVLAYCQLRNRQGQWVGCECCFTIVHDVMVCCTSIYRRGMVSQKRAVEAPIVRRLFSSSPKDPRYHMLSHLSSKFEQGPKEQSHEPRAALFLNRFTRTLTIMYATSGIEQILGIPADAMKGRSFYFCIAENCLEDAVRCLESAKGNDSIAYLRFWFRDPRQDDPAPDSSDGTEDEEMTDILTSEDDEGGVGLTHSASGAAERHPSGESNGSNGLNGLFSSEGVGRNGLDSRTSSGDSGNPVSSHEAIFGDAARSQSSTSSAVTSPESIMNDPVELEAVVSCASDGLVVCLRRARPFIPGIAPAAEPTPTFTNGMFAAPWAQEPMFMPPLPEPQQPPTYAHGGMPLAGPNIHFSAPRPHYTHGGPNRDEFLNSIRDVAVFAWALTGINGSLSDYSRGKPGHEATPQDGLPVWAPKDGQPAYPPFLGTGHLQEQSHDSGFDSRSGSGSRSGQENNSPGGHGGNGSNGGQNGHGGPVRRDIFGDPGLSNNHKAPPSYYAHTNGHHQSPPGAYR